MISLIYPELDNFFDYMPDNTLFILFEPAELEKVADQTLEQASKSFVAARKEARLCVEPESLYLTWSKVKDLFMHRKTLTLKKLSVSKGALTTEQSLRRFDFSVKGDISTSMELAHHREEPVLERPVRDDPPTDPRSNRKIGPTQEDSRWRFRRRRSVVSNGFPHAVSDRTGH